MLLANLDPEALEERWRRCGSCHTRGTRFLSASSLRDYLAQVREDGFAIADQQLEAGFRTIAVPVRDAAGAMVAGINVIVPIARSAVAQMRARYLEPLNETARQIGAALAK